MKDRLRYVIENNPSMNWLLAYYIIIIYYRYNNKNNCVRLLYNLRFF